MIGNLKTVFFILSTVLFCNSFVCAQNALQKKISHSLDSIAVQIEKRLANIKIIPVIETIRKQAIQNQLHYEHASTYLLESNQHFLNGDWKSALKSSENALKIAKKLPKSDQKTEIIVKCLNSIGYVYSYQGNFAEGLSKRLSALEIAEKGSCSNKEMGNLLSWIADDYRHLDQHDKAIEYLKKVKKYLPYMTNESVVDYYYTLCQSLAALNKYTEAKKKLYELDAFILESKKLTAYDKNVANLQSSKLHGEFAMKEKKYDDAITYYKNYYKYSNLMKSEVHIAIALNKIAKAYLLFGNKQQALYYFKLSYDSCMKDGSIDYAFKNANSIASLYAEKMDFKNAYQYSQTAFELKDSLNSTERIKELSFLEAKYEAGKKEKEIAQLKLKNTENELIAEKNNTILLIGGIIATVLILLFGFLYYINLQKRKITEKEKQSMQQQQQVISLQAMINGQETERIRIAKDLHDSMGGTFSTIKMHLSSLEYESKDNQQSHLLEKCIKIVGNAAVDVRRIAHNMMPEVLIKLGLLDSIADLTANINSAKQLNVNFQYFGMEKRLSSDFEIMLYRIVQELLNNIIKHSNATQAIIQFVKEQNILSITIEDNGKGFSKETETEGIGLKSVQERVQYLNGVLSIDSENYVGTTVIMEFLLTED